MPYILNEVEINLLLKDFSEDIKNEVEFSLHHQPNLVLIEAFELFSDAEKNKYDINCEGCHINLKDNEFKTLLSKMKAKCWFLCDIEFDGSDDSDDHRDKIYCIHILSSLFLIKGPFEVGQNISYTNFILKGSNHVINRSPKLYTLSCFIDYNPL